MFGATTTSNEPAKLDVGVHPPPPPPPPPAPPSKPNRKSLDLFFWNQNLLIFDIGAPTSPPPKQQQQFDPQTKETDHDKANLVVRSGSDA